MSFWMRRPGRSHDTMLTLATWSTVLCLLKVVLNGVKYGGVEFGTIDATIIGALLTPTLTAYVARRWKDKPDKDDDDKPNT